MPDQTLRPLCFVAMPFGKRAPPGKRTPLIDFDRIYRAIEEAVEAEGMECVRADFERSGGFIHKPMYERLLVAEYVIADLTLGNPNVMYEVGVRHGASARATLLLSGSGFAWKLPFDFAPLRVIQYELTRSGGLGKTAAGQLGAAIRERLAMARRGELPIDNPIMQVTAWRPSGRLDHQKTDAFLGRMKSVTEVGAQVADAIAKCKAKTVTSEEATATLDAIVARIASSDAVEQLHSTLVSLFLGYRELSAWQRMADLYPKLPRELQQTPMAREQLALARNRLAEQAEKEGNAELAAGFRTEALRAVEAIPELSRTSETWGILGRIYKGWSAAEATRKPAKSRAYLDRAIECYETGFRTDPRDYYPGVNAVTLRLERGTQADRDKLTIWLPVVRFAVERAPLPKDDMEKYWQRATGLELDTAARKWDQAKDSLRGLLAIVAAPWMRQTTIDNLLRQRATLADKADIAALDEVIGALQKA